MALKNAKSVLRKELKSRLRSLSEDEKQRQSNILAKMLLATPEYKRSKRVSVYLSMTDEVQTLSVVKDILGTNRVCYIPRYVGPKMDMVRLHSLSDYESLPETTWHIKQPPVDEEREEALQAGGLDLIVMPGLGFTRSGDRIGRGKGYYDTYLTKCKAVMGRIPTTIALAYFQQVCDSIPTSQLDVQIDKVLFEEPSSDST